VTATPFAQGVRSLVDDLVLLAACLVCLAGARRYWVIWACALALLEVCMDTLAIAATRVPLFACQSANIIWSYLLAAVLVWASLTASRDSAPAWRAQRAT
jgi:hypothetical protein